MAKQIYKGKEVGGTVTDANQILYNNKDSSLEATNIQSAIDKISDKVTDNEQSINNLNSNFNKIYYSRREVNIAINQPVEGLYRSMGFNLNIPDNVGCVIAQAHGTDEEWIALNKKNDSGNSIFVIWSTKPYDNKHYYIDIIGFYN